MTLADEDTNSILNDDDNKTILGIIIFASGVTWWPNVREKLILQIYVVLKCLVLLVTEKIELNLHQLGLCLAVLALNHIYSSELPQLCM